MIPNSHRALDDAKLAHAVLIALYQKVLELPIELLAEIVRLSEPIDWDGSLMFSQALREKGRMPVEARKAQQDDYGELFGGAAPIAAPLIPAETTTPLDADELAAKIEHGGPFAHYFENFEVARSKSKCYGR